MHKKEDPIEKEKILFEEAEDTTLLPLDTEKNRTTSVEEEKIENTEPAEIYSRKNRNQEPSIDLKKFGRKNHHNHLVRNSTLGIILLIGLGFIGFGVYAYTLTKNQIVQKEDQANIFQQVHRIIDKDVQPLQGEKEDRINIVLFGKGGEGHEGANLTDTIMVVSIKPSTNQVSMVSIPRDLVVNYADSTNPKYAEYYKINGALAQKGTEFAIQKVEEVVGEKIHYYAIVDFDGFKDVVDSLGGVEVTVDTTFTDYQYPDYNYGYQTITFKAGTQTMDGETSLQYSRSRHGNNGEGSDLKRAQRQQKIIEGIRTKALSSSTYLNPAKISSLLQDLGDHVTTNAEIWEMTRFAELVQKIDKNTIINEVIDNSPEGLVHSEIASTGAFIFLPNAGVGNYTEIHEMVSTIFDQAPTDSTIASDGTTNSNENTNTAQKITAETIAQAQSEHAIVVVLNGTNITGFASKTAEDLHIKGVDVGYVGNAIARTITHTTIYKVSKTEYASTQPILEQVVGASIESATVPENNSNVRLATDIDPTIVDMSVVPANTDFIILLGPDTAPTANAL